MKAREVKGLDPAAPLGVNAERIVQTRVAELLALAGPAFDPAATGAQHDLRIAAKRLRYLLELTGPCLGAEAEAGRRAARELQDVLGKLHDCDVMAPRVEDVPSLRAFLRTRRELLFRRFRTLWEEQSERGVWAALASSG